MDPFSLTVGAVSLIDVCQRFTKFAVKVYKEGQTIDEDLRVLFRRVEELERVTTLIKNVASTDGHQDATIGEKEKKKNKLNPILSSIKELLPKCESIVDKLYKILTSVEAAHLPRLFENLDKFYKEIKRKAKETDFTALQHSLYDHYQTLCVLLQAANYCLARESQSSQEENASNTRELFAALNSKLDDFKSRLEYAPSGGFSKAFAAIKAVVALDSNNKYFDIPQSVSSIFTGRDTMLDDLHTWMLETESESRASFSSHRNLQKRFVVCGLGGSGKTQFCCKFAQEHRERFWGVFWIDGSSQEKADHGFASLARNAGLEPNARAGKRWLSSLDKRWLLLIDSADDPKLDLESLYPEGHNGHILITTTNPEHKTQGTIGDRFFDFSPGDPENAQALLLRAASTPEPWSSSALKLATAIVSTLGYLPLAIIIAGKTILKGKCTLSEYLKFHETDLQRTREEIYRRKSSDANTSSLPKDARSTIYATCEITYNALLFEDTQASRDAVELLNVFSFLNKDNIPMLLLKRAGANVLSEMTASKSGNQQEPLTDWSTWLQQTLTWIYMLSRPDPPKPVLPELMLPHSSEFDYWRLKDALVELTSRSLIMYNANTDSYLVHPIVHRWVRDRPEMTAANQAYWCEAAATIVSYTIVLPPDGTSVETVDFHRSLLPHTISVLDHQKKISHQFCRNREQRTRYLPFGITNPIMTRGITLRLAKYSLVFVLCGRYQEALGLQLIAHDFLHKMLGPDHEKTIKIKMALSGSYWYLGRGNEAADLQQNALNSSLRALGPKHAETLRLMDQLGSTFWMLGRFKEALALHEAAIKGLESIFGSDDADVLRAKDHLGRVENKYYRFERAYELHSIAADGLYKTLGKEDTDTLTAQDNVACVLMDLGGEAQLKRAQDIAEDVLAIRKAKLGTEHYYTLWSMLTLTRIKAQRGQYEEAEAEIRAGLVIANRALGPDHLGVLAGRSYLGNILNLSGRTDQAIIELEEVCRKQANMPSATRGLHPDLFNSWYMLSDCYRNINRYDDGINVCTEAMKGISDLGGTEHPMMKKWEERLNQILEERERAVTDAIPGLAKDTTYQSLSGSTARIIA